MTSQFKRIKTIYRSNPWKGRFILFLLGLLIVLAVIRLLLPQTIISSSVSWLNKQGIDSSIEAININIFDGKISLINASGSKNSTPLFNIDLIDIHWLWKPLSDKKIEITGIVIDHLGVNIEKYTDTLIIGGVHIPLAETQKKDDAQLKEPTVIDSKHSDSWAALLDKLTFSNLNICYLDHSAPYNKHSEDSKQIDYCVTAEEISWQGTASYNVRSTELEAHDLPLFIKGDFLLRGLAVKNNTLDKYLIRVASNKLNNISIAGLNNVHIEKIEINELSALQRDEKQHNDTIRFQQILISDLKLNKLNSVDINSIAIDQPALYLVKQNEKNWEFQQWLPAISDTKQDNNNRMEINQNNGAPASGLKISLARLKLDNPDFCYLENNSPINYCLTLEALNWQGKINYDTSTAKTNNPDSLANGNLTLLRPRIQNNLLKRNLVEIKSISLTNFDLTADTKVTLDDFKVKGLTALQRSAKQNDNTLSFSDLHIDKVNYTGNDLTINSLELVDLANNVSKNKNGDWEHDKWLISNDDQTKPKSSSNNDKQHEGKVLGFTLNSITIVSDKETLFTDNSTQPALTAGLKKLSFNMSKLSSATPNNDSVFKLHAKTSRHSTIDIEGTARPLAKNVSFDADGSVKGFDLRAVSPATKKAIGHIINTGQMDADLQLRATEGILASNINLSLYQFNIKPMSKEDAENLDKIFGMPLNQALVLLRNKDNSIHLDIPITGDINNPDFNPMDAIVKATTKATTLTLITFYTPYGLVYAGGNVLFDLATALNFDPLTFNPGSSELINENKAQLDKLAALLTEKPQIHLTLCGVTNQDDVFVLYPETKKQGENTTLSVDKIATLNLLANERQNNSKNYLIINGKIKHDRLILCEPEYKANEKNIAGVEINI